jgi:hypothetical protein
MNNRVGIVMISRRIVKVSIHSAFGADFVVSM